MIIKRRILPVLIVMIGFSGCGGKKKPVVDKNKKHTSRVDMPLAEKATARLEDDETVRSFFDQDMDEFVSLAQQEGDIDLSLPEAVDAESKAEKKDDFSWVESSNQDGQFNLVYFNFNDHFVRQDQEERVIQNIEQAKHVFNTERSNVPAIVVIEGHACHSAGSAIYNLALSEKRAKAVSDWFVSAGIPKENIRIVGRGFEVPTILNGKAVDGDREEQWLNRRVEFHLIPS